MNQAVYFTNNQYDPKIIEQMFHQIHEKSWDYCMQVQKSMCRHRIIGGPMTDFVCDESLNLKMGFPEGSYSLFTPQKIIKQETKYVIERFFRKKELISLLDIIQNPRFNYGLGSMPKIALLSSTVPTSAPAMFKIFMEDII